MGDESHHELLEVVDFCPHIEEDLVEDLPLIQRIRVGGAGASEPNGKPRTVRFRQESQQRIGIDCAVGEQDGHLLGRVFQLAHVAGPAVAGQKLYGLGRELQRRHAVLFAKIRRELPEKQVNIPRTFAERGHRDRHLVQAVIQVLTEPSRSNGLPEIHVRSGHHADVGLQHLRRAYADELARLEDAEQPHLGGERQLRHLVEEDGTAMGLFEVPLPGLGGAGKRTFLVPEELGVDGAFRDGAAVHRDVGAVFAGGGVVDDAGHDLLARTAFAENEDADVGGGHALRHGDGAVQRGAGADDAEPAFQRGDVGHASAGSSVTTPSKVAGVWPVVRTLT